MKTPHIVFVRGRESEYCLTVDLTPAEVEYMRADGFQVDPVINTIPQWVASLRLTRVWCWLQDHKVLPL